MNNKSIWCPNDLESFNNSTNHGQIDYRGVVGQTIINYVKNNKLNNILEIGTWNGLGSTKCFLLALENNLETNFISIESNNDKLLIAINNLESLLLKHNNIKLLHGTIIKKDEIIDINNIFPEFESNSEFKRWHEIDIQNIDNSPYIYDDILNEIDFLLLDGGEFTTYYEFIKLFPKCTKFIALDDVNVPKCKKIREILLNNNNWKEIEYIKERNHFSLFKKII